MRRLLPLIPLFVISMLVDIGYGQTNTQKALPELGWGLARVAESLGLGKDTLVLHSVEPVERKEDELILTPSNETRFITSCSGKIFGRKGVYSSIEFNEDTLYRGSVWLLDFPSGEIPYQVFNSLRENFLSHGYELKIGTNPWPANPSDQHRSIAFVRGSTRYVLSYDDTSMYLSTFVDARLHTGIEYMPPTMGWTLSQAAYHYGQDMDRLVLDSLVDENGTWFVQFVGRFCEQDGYYSIIFDEDTLLVGHTWLSISANRHQVYNAIIRHLQSFGFKTETNDAELFATSSDVNKSVSLNLASRTVMIELSESYVFATTKDRDFFY